MPMSLNRHAEERMQSALELPYLIFVKALQSFKAGGIRLDTLLEAARLAHAAGAASADLWELLEQREAYGSLNPVARSALEHQLRTARPPIETARANERTPVPDNEVVESPSGPSPLLSAGYDRDERTAQAARHQDVKAHDVNAPVFELPSWFSIDGTNTALPRHPQSGIEQVPDPSLSNASRLMRQDVDESLASLPTNYATAPSLEELIQSGELHRDRVLLLLGNVVQELEASHAAGVVHGHLSPARILVLPSNEVKLIDFAILKGPAVLQPHTNLHGYTSPQRLMGEPLQISDDVYSLACLAQQLLTRSNDPVNGSGWLSTVRGPRSKMTSGQSLAIQRALQPSQLLRTARVSTFMQEFTQLRAPLSSARLIGWICAIVAGGLILAFVFLTPHPRSQIPAVLHQSPVNIWETPGRLLKDCAECPVMRVIGPGVFVQGDDGSSSSFERPQHQVAIASFFAVAAYAVTVGEFRRFSDETSRSSDGCYVYDGGWHYKAAANWRLPNFVQTSRHPVTCVSWEDAMAYVAWLSAKSGHHYRLPSAAEWEYAARAGESAPVPWESPSEACRIANVADQTAELRYPGWQVFACEDQYVHTAPVGSFTANKWGLQDMLGNVLAWTADCWYPNYLGAPVDGSARVEAGCQDRELRGGSWFSNPSYVRASYRNHFAGAYRSSTTGIRVVRDESP